MSSYSQLLKQVPVTRHDFYMAAVLARREVRDSFRDWRIPDAHYHPSPSFSGFDELYCRAHVGPLSPIMARRSSPRR
ncbi:MAG: hypothetical protein M5U34_31015 [Chloroflexi bacterium]|nr:hypothetical protein [Chloroflexota bacterium]